MFWFSGTIGSCDLINQLQLQYFGVISHNYNYVIQPSRASGSPARDQHAPSPRHKRSALSAVYKTSIISSTSV